MPGTPAAARRVARRSILYAAVAALALVAIAWWFRPALDALGIDAHVGSLAETIRSWGRWGVAASIGLMIAHSFVPFPAEVVALANGMVYGAFWGTVVTWIGAMLGASAAFAVGRARGRPLG
ncbi:MAG: VTT domain-containing protein, partial [Burkholderiales bacterium]|nr:VTT domain-containing protein [Burkholderiales bacterium]